MRLTKVRVIHLSASDYQNQSTDPESLVDATRNEPAFRTYPSPPVGILLSEDDN